MLWLCALPWLNKTLLYGRLVACGASSIATRPRRTELAQAEHAEEPLAFPYASMAPRPVQGTGPVGWVVCIYGLFTHK